MKSTTTQESKSGGLTSDALRSEIAHTREDMDHTLDEIEQRITPRHLIEEALGYFRSHRPDKEVVKDKAGAALHKAGDAASNVRHAVTDTIREHPIPTLLIGAGLAWAMYERHRESRVMDYPDDDEPVGEGEGEIHGEWSQEGSFFETKSSDQTEDKMEDVKENISGGIDSAKEKLASASEGIRQKGRELGRRVAAGGRAARERAGELSHRVGEKARHGYEVSREKFTQTSHEHPLTVGLGFLAAGLLAGLALPHSRREDRWIGDTSDRVKSRAREKGGELVDRGKHVASAAVEAAKQAAEQEGLTPEGMKEKVRHVAEETQRAAEQKARDEGLQKPSI